jgi:hypothetical protein
LVSRTPQPDNIVHGIPARIQDAAMAKIAGLSGSATWRLLGRHAVFDDAFDLAPQFGRVLMAMHRDSMLYGYLQELALAIGADRD